MESNEVIDKSVSVSISFSDPMFSVRFQKFYLDSLGFSSDQYTTISTQLLLKKNNLTLILIHVLTMMFFHGGMIGPFAMESCSY